MRSAAPWSSRLTKFCGLALYSTSRPSSMATTSPAPRPAASHWVSFGRVLVEVGAGAALDDLDVGVRGHVLLVELLVAELAEDVDGQGDRPAVARLVAAAAAGGDEQGGGRRRGPPRRGGGAGRQPWVSTSLKAGAGGGRIGSRERSHDRVVGASDALSRERSLELACPDAIDGRPDPPDASRAPPRAGVTPSSDGGVRSAGAQTVQQVAVAGDVQRLEAHPTPERQQQVARGAADLGPGVVVVVVEDGRGVEQRHPLAAQPQIPLLGRVGRGRAAPPRASRPAPAAGPPAARCPAPRSPRRRRASPPPGHRPRWRAGRPSGAPPSRAPSDAARSRPSSAAGPSSTPVPPGRARRRGSSAGRTPAATAGAGSRPGRPRAASRRAGWRGQAGAGERRHPVVDAGRCAV